MKKFIYILLIIPLFFTSCNDDDDEPKLADLPDISVVDISQESDWDYWVAGKKDYYYIKANSSRTLPVAALFHSSEANKDYSIFFTDNGKIDKVVVDDYIFVFRNFNGNHVDIGIIYPNGEIETFREIETPNYNWNKLTLSKSLAEWSDVVRWTSRAVAGVPCAISVVAAIHTAGLAIPAAAWTCGNYLLSLGVDIAVNEGNTHNGFTDLVGIYSLVSTQHSCNTVVDPTTLASCLSGVASTALSELADGLEELENRKDDVRITEAALEHGYGDVQITLTWDNGADLDLHVVDPNGEEIWWRHTYSASNGKLDVDDIDGYGPENIFWPRLEAPNGTYKVYVHHYPSSPSTSNYTVLINAFGKIKKYTGSINNNQLIHIKDFNQNGFKSIIDKNSISITTNAIK